MTIYACRIRGNLKGSCDLTIGPKTLLWGVKGAGKSRIVNTIELALSGYASDIAGRPTMSRATSLIEMAPPGERLEAHVQLSTGGSAFYEIERNGADKTRKPRHSPAEGVTVVYPLSDALKALRGSVENAERFVLTYSGLDVTDDAILERFPAAQRSIYSTFLATQNESGIEALLNVSAQAKRTMTAASAGLKQAERILESVGKNVPALKPAEENIRGAKDYFMACTKKQAEATIQSAQARPDVAAYRAGAERAIEELKTRERQEHHARVDYFDYCASRNLDPGAEGSPHDVALRSALTVLLEEYAGLAVAHPGTSQGCVLCLTGQVKLDADALHKRQDGFVRANTVHAQKEELRERLSAVETATRQALRGAQQAVARFQEKQALSDALEAEGYSELARARLDRDVSEAQDAYQDLITARNSWAVLQQARDTREDSRREAREAKDLAAACKEVITALVEESRTLFVRRVQTFLPPEDQFGLLLSTGERSRCSFGLMRDGHLHSALSGAEWAGLTLALGASITPTGPDVLAILTPEERAFDAATLRRVMVALTDAPGQVILTSPIKPKGRTPKGWTVIEIGAEVIDAE